MKIIQYKKPEDIAHLPKHVQDSFQDKHELSHIRRIEDTYYIILQYPGKPDAIHTGNLLEPLCITKSADITTLIYKNLPTRLKKEKDLTDLPLTDLIMITINEYTDSLLKINKRIQHYERHMDNLSTKKDIHKLFDLMRELINYQTAIEAIDDTVQYISNEKIEGLYNTETSYEYANLLIELHQLTKNIVMSIEIINSILNVSESLFANNLSQTVRTLTAITIVLSIPGLITGYYSMNIYLPHQDSEHILFYIFFATLVATAIIAWIFHKKKYI